MAVSAHARLGVDDGRQLVQREMLRGERGQRRLVHREPVHREEGVDIAACALRGGARGVVDEFLRAHGIGKHPQHVAGPQECEPRGVVVRQLAGADLGEHRVGLLAAAEPRKCMGANEVRLGTGSGPDRRFGQSIRERQIRQPHRPVGGPHQQVGVGSEV